MKKDAATTFATTASFVLVVNEERGRKSKMAERRKRGIGMRRGRGMRGSGKRKGR